MATLVLHDATLIDGTGAGPRARTSVLIEDGVIRQIGPADILEHPRDANVIDLSGLTLMPGLTDAHVHFGLVGINYTSTPSDEDSLVNYVLGVVDNIETALQEGFTTVRDAGGLDPAFARATRSGAIKGPRILPSGSPLSQTGGHGDHRIRYDPGPTISIPGILAASEICDGADAVRAAARRQLRQGATQVKVMASGGVMSQTDELESVQFTVEEMQAAVHEAHAAGTYVLAHCHTPPAIDNALAAGVRSIEHGSILDEGTAARIMERGAFMVPTMAVIEILARSPEGLEVSDYSLMKLSKVRSQIPISVEMAARTGVHLGSGSDLLGAEQSRRGEELVYKAEVLGPMDAIVSATQTNSKLFRLEDRIGTVQEGKEADLIAVHGDPLADIELLADASNVRLVVMGGEIAKDTL